MAARVGRFVFLLLVSMALTLSSFGSSTGAPQPSILRVGLAGPPKTFNPLRTTDDYSLRPLEFMWGPLARWNDDLRFEPYFAKSWEVSPDGSTWTFHLRPEVKWSDGAPFTAEDVKFTWRMLSHKATGGIWVGSLRNIRGVNEYFDGKAKDISGIQVVDSKTLRVRLVAPAPAPMFLQDIHYFVLPSHVLKGYSPEKINDAPFWSRPHVSNGPYTFVEYKTNEYIRLRKNPTYFLGAPKIDEIIIRIGNPQALLAQFEKGEIDLLEVLPQEVARLQGFAHVKIHRLAGAWYNELLHMNVSRPYLKDKRVRQAMYYSLDRPGLAKTAYEGYAQVVVSPSKAVWAKPANEPAYAYDLEKAKQLLKDAGWSASQEVEILVASSEPAEQRIAAILKESLSEAGMATTIVQLDFPTLLTRIQKGEFDTAIVGWNFNGDPNETARVYWSKNVPPAGWNVMRYRNARVDQLYELGRATLDQSKRAQIYKELQGILDDELPAPVLVRIDKLIGVNARVQGVQPRKFRKEAFSSDLWNVQTWTIAR
jgi:peptide/nickel transport system substrate-binding protein